MWVDVCSTGVSFGYIKHINSSFSSTNTLFNPDGEYQSINKALNKALENLFLIEHKLKNAQEYLRSQRGILTNKEFNEEIKVNIYEKEIIVIKHWKGSSKLKINFKKTILEESFN